MDSVTPRVPSDVRMSTCSADSGEPWSSLILTLVSTLYPSSIFMLRSSVTLTFSVLVSDIIGRTEWILSPSLSSSRMCLPTVTFPMTACPAP